MISGRWRVNSSDDDTRTSRDGRRLTARTENKTRRSAVRRTRSKERKTITHRSRRRPISVLRYVFGHHPAGRIQRRVVRRHFERARHRFSPGQRRRVGADDHLAASAVGDRGSPGPSTTAVVCGGTDARAPWTLYETPRADGERRTRTARDEHATRADGRRNGVGGIAKTSADFAVHTTRWSAAGAYLPISTTGEPNIVNK